MSQRPTSAVTAEDSVLVAGARAGEVREFAVLFDRHVNVVRRVIYDNVRNPEDHADAVQEVFARALANLDRLHDPAHFRSWLLGIARHVAIDGRRRRSKDGERLSDRPTDELPTRHRGPSGEVELRALGGRVRGAIAALPPREATAVALATYLDLGPAEIADALGVSAGNAKVIVHRARRRMRNALTIEMLKSGGGCDEFGSLDALDLDGLAEHVANCSKCQRQAAVQLHVE